MSFIIILIALGVVAAGGYYLAYNKSKALSDLQDAYDNLRSIVATYEAKLKGYEQQLASKAESVAATISTDVKSAVTAVEAEVKKLV